MSCKRTTVCESYCPEKNLGICEIEGYGYKYRFRAMDDDVIRNKIIDGYEPSLEKKVYFFEIKTKFVLLKRRRLDDDDHDHDDDDEEEMLGTEIYWLCMHDSYGEDYLKERMSRLKAFGMPEEAIEYLVCGLFDFAKQCSVDDDDRLVIPVGADLRVCTVQLERETIDEAYDRAVRVRAECLNLPKIRVEDVDQGLTLMEMCPICLLNPAVGAEISLLPCGHAFHSHCIVQWFSKSNSCPFCRFQVCNDLL